MRVVISSGHGKYVRGASGYLDEVDEARRVVEAVADELAELDVECETFHDDVSTSQNENLNRIVNAHNAEERDLDVSIHFNAFETTAEPMGTECLYLTQADLANDVASRVSAAGGLIDRGPKKRTDLFFLNNTDAPAILVEVCFVDSEADADAYAGRFNEICGAIASAIAGEGAAIIPPAPRPPAERPTLSKGDAGPDVEYLQRQLNSDNDAGLDPDGDFGSKTDQAVRAYQASRYLNIDGVVGPQTWEALEKNAPPYIPPGLPEPLSEHDQAMIAEITMNGAIATYSWQDRGMAPPGYIKGLALAFANVYRKLNADHAGAIEMAKARSDSEYDALNLYREDCAELGLDIDAGGPDTLRALFALLLGHGMRESSGRHCEGRDLSADNVSSETAEAGLYQTSYNAHACHPTFDQVMDEYLAGAANDNPQGFLNVFAEGVYCDKDEWGCYGSGSGYTFQRMCKEQPAFAVESAAITLRNLANHYGPIIRHETELRIEAARMLRAVQAYIDRRMIETV